MWLEMHINYKSVQCFQVGGVRNAQSDLKQVSYISKVKNSVLRFLSQGTSLVPRTLQLTRTHSLEIFDLADTLKGYCTLVCMNYSRTTLEI